MAVVALRLFERRGFERVTMDDVAEASSVSRRTLFRVFPSKADLVWEGLNEVLDAVKLRLAALPRRRLPLTSLFEELLAPTLRQLGEPGAALLARRGLRLIGASPALLNHQTLEKLQRVITAAISSRGLRGAAPPSLVARSLVSVTFGAILWWAEDDRHMTPLQAAGAALGVLSQFGGPGI
jgi:AcrR family transcriptional regulator